MIIKNVREIPTEILEQFCLNSKSFSTDHIRVISEMNSQNNSFAVYEGSRLLAICPFILEQRNGNNIASLWGLSLPKPILSNEITNKDLKPTVLKKIYETIDSLCSEHQIKKISFAHFFNHENFKDINETLNELSLFGYIPQILKSAVVDLRPDLETIYRSFSKGHKSALKKISSELKCTFQNSQTKALSAEDFKVELKSFDEFSKEEFEHLNKLYSKNLLDICFVEQEGQLASISLFKKINNEVEYFQSKRLIETPLPVHHYVISSAVNQYKGNFSFLNLGIFSYSSQLIYILSEKKKSIGLFKRGFGPDIYNMIVAEKYFDKIYFMQEYSNRINSFAETL